MIIVASLASCSKKSVPYIKRKGINVTEAATALRIGGGDKVLQIQYLGCGGLYIRHSGQAVMIDPFFSNQRFLKIGKSIFLGGKIRSKPEQISFALQRIKDSLNIPLASIQEETKAIFAAHGHYDHLMDVPYIHHYWFDQKTDVYVNASSFNSCANVIASNKLHDMEPLISDRNQRGESIDLPAKDGSILKIYPLLAAHNPHTRNFKFFSGSIKHPLPHYNDPKDKTSVHDWLEGQTLSFLLDIVEGNEIVFRIFIQSSSAHFPDGLPPQSLLKEKRVDLAVLGTASYKFSELTYPCEYLNKMSPTHVMFIHWEDFFRPYDSKPKTLLKNDIPRFFQKILSACRSTYILPLPGVVVSITY